MQSSHHSNNETTVSGPESVLSTNLLQQYAETLAPQPQQQQNSSENAAITTLANSATMTTTTITTDDDDYVSDPVDPTRVLRDAQNRPVTVDRWLQCKPLQSEILNRPGPGGRKLHYMSGDCVTRTLNQTFGYQGWNLTVLKTDQVVCNQTQGGRWQVAYMAQVRITHTKSQSFREDVGAGDSLDKSLATAVQHALKGSITDAMKRAARHFGDKLGNSLYSSDFQYRYAPKTPWQALELLEKECQKQFPKRTGAAVNNNNNSTHVLNTSTAVVNHTPVAQQPPSSAHMTASTSSASSVVANTAKTAMRPPPSRVSLPGPIHHATSSLTNAPGPTNNTLPTQRSFVPGRPASTPTPVTNRLPAPRHPPSVTPTTHNSQPPRSSSNSGPPPTVAAGMGMLFSSGQQQQQSSWNPQQVRPPSTSRGPSSKRPLEIETPQPVGPLAAKKPHLNPYAS